MLHRVFLTVRPRGRLCIKLFRPPEEYFLTDRFGQRILSNQTSHAGCTMSFTKLVIGAIGLSALVIPFNATNAQFAIHSSDGTKVIGEVAPPDSPDSKTKGETWTRTYAPGEQEREHRQAVEQERLEQQKAVAEREEERRLKENEAKTPIIVIDTPPPVVVFPWPIVSPRPPVPRPPVPRPPVGRPPVTGRPS
jgi:hypothetical protein